MAASIPLASGASIPLPPGYKFNPTDQDIVRYLRCRALSQPLPSTIISDMDILEHNPWDLVPDAASEKFYFYRRVMRWANSTRWKRAAKGGYWKASGEEVPIYCTGVRSTVPIMVRIKRTLVFYSGKSPSGEHTNWMMQEYRLSGGGLSPYLVVKPHTSNLGESSFTAMVGSKKCDDPDETLRGTAPSIANTSMMLNPDCSWVVCRIRQKMTTRRPPIMISSNSDTGAEKIPFFDFLGQGNNDKGTGSSSMPPGEGKL